MALRDADGFARVDEGSGSLGLGAKVKFALCYYIPIP